MKKLLRSLCVLSLALFVSNAAWSEDASKQNQNQSQKIRLLIFGNSFSNNSTTHLLELAREGKKDLVFLNLVKGGCSLQEDAAAVKAAQTAPDSPQSRFFSQGGNAPRVGPAGGKKVNALEAIKAGPWDYVSIQQYSLL